MSSEWDQCLMINRITTETPGVAICCTNRDQISHLASPTNRQQDNVVDYMYLLQHFRRFAFPFEPYHYPVKYRQQACRRT